MNKVTPGPENAFIGSEDLEKDKNFEELFDGFFMDLTRIAHRITRNLEVAEELCQEAFLRYYERRHRLPAGNEARFWLIRVVKNLAYNHEKRRGREHTAYKILSSESRMSAVNEGELRVLIDESRKSVQEALATLPHRLRVPLILKEYSGYRYCDIARIMKITEGNVKIRIFRARRLLAKLLS